MVLVVVGVLTPSRASAAKKGDVTIAFTAVVETVEDSGLCLGGSIAPGDRITGLYTYNLSTPDEQPDNPNVGDYWHTTAPYGIQVQAGGHVFRTDPGNVNFLVEIVNNLSGSDNYLLRSYTNLPLSSGTCTVEHISWQLDDPSQKALSSDKLPAKPPKLSNWQSIFGLDLVGQNPSTGEFYFVRAHVTTVRTL
jgi:hypothetical protein